MLAKSIRAVALTAILGMPAIAVAGDWKADASRIDAEMKSFDKRQGFKMEDACTAQYVQVSPNRKDVSYRKVDLKGINGESIENGAGGSYTEQFNFSSVNFDCHRGPGTKNCTDDRYTFGILPVKPGSEPAMCKHLLSVIATCQNVASFKPSKRGCDLLQWEKDFIKGGSKKPVQTLGR
jgi:hypothetical protein